MKYRRLFIAGRWVPLLLLMGGLLAAVPDAAAQARERGRERTGRKEQVEKRKTKARKQDQKPPRQRADVSERSKRSPAARGKDQVQRREARPVTGAEARESRTRRAETKGRESRTRSAARPSDRRERSPATRRAPRTRQGDPGVKRGDRTRRGNPDVDSGRRGRVEQRESRQQVDPGVKRGDRTRRGNPDVDSGRRGRVEQRESRQQVDRRRDGSGRRAPRTVERTPARRVDRTPKHRDGRRRDRRYRPNYHHRDTWRQRYEHNNRYHKRHWKRRSHLKKRHYRPFVVRPFIDVDVYWPWVHRHQHGWRPRYRYRQVIYVESGWGGRRHDARIDVRTYYTHELRHATRDRAEVDVYVDRIEFYEDGRYLGSVDRIPDQLARIRATIHRGGGVRFDRDVFVVGDPYAGFELISTRHYDGFLYDHYRPAHGLRAGVVDLQRERVVPASHSRLFDPYDFRGYVPVSLLPEEDGWLLDYGQGSFSAVYYDDDPYYYGGYTEYAGDVNYGGDYYEEDYFEDDAGRLYFSVRSTVDDGNFGVSAVTKVHDRKHRTSFGAQIHLKRETEFVRVR